MEHLSARGDVRMMDGYLEVTDRYITQTASVHLKHLGDTHLLSAGPVDITLLTVCSLFMYCFYTKALFVWFSPSKLVCNIFVMAHVYLCSALKLQSNRCSLLLLTFALFPKTALSISTSITFFSGVLKAALSFLRWFRFVHFKRSDITGLPLWLNP